MIANTGDDIELYGAHVSPDPDLVCFWLAGLIDDARVGPAGDTFAVMDALRGLGRETWFNLGDRDLAWCLERARMLAEGLTPTAALGAPEAGHRVEGRRAADVRSARANLDPHDGRWRAFQEFMIRERAAGPIEGVELRGIEGARPSREVLAAARERPRDRDRTVQSARLDRSDPGRPGMREAIAAATAPVVAVSPIVGGRILKGPTAAFMSFAGHELSAAGVVEHYGGAARRNRRR